MCGICGVFNLTGEPADEQVVRHMCSVLRHRGPDAEGTMASGCAAIGMRRLSIIDLVTGDQPIPNEEKTMWTVCNGEIYNYRELRHQLSRMGHTFRTAADTEVIVHAYEQWGQRCLKRLNGMFAFAVWDSRSRELLLARDPIGIKPLYYALDGDRLLFGSEIKALLEVPGFQPTLSSEAVEEYLAYGMVLAPRTIYREVRKLRPGHCILASTRGDCDESQYWRMPPVGVLGQSREPTVPEVWERFCRSVEMQMVSDVGLGAFLSGGVDSSAVVAAMAAVSERPVKTFTIRMPGGREDESPHARAVARHLGTSHHEMTVDVEHLQDVLPRLAWHFDEPFGDSSAVPTYYLSKLTREHVTVALSGDGGDELFAGYDQFRFERLVGILGRVSPGSRRKVLNRFSDLLSRQTGSPRVSRVLHRFRRLTDDAMQETSVHRFFQKAMIARAPVRRQILSRDLGAIDIDQVDVDGRARAYLEGGCPKRPVEALLQVHTEVRLPDDMLTKVDRASMAHSLEVRVPFLDHSLVEYVAGIPTHSKLRGLSTKHILKRALCQHLPRRLVYRRKQGFSLPLDGWFRGSFTTYAREVLNGTSLVSTGIIDRDGIDGLISEHQSGHMDHSAILYSVVMLACWYDQFHCASGRGFVRTRCRTS
jgi:asparagine synthase (glutamine-hydrolysing)